MGIMSSLSLVSGLLLSVSNIKTVCGIFLMSSFAQGMLGEKIVVCRFLMGTSV